MCSKFELFVKYNELFRGHISHLAKKQMAGVVGMERKNAIDYK